VTVPVGHPEWWREGDDDRVAEIRAQYLRRTTRWAGEDGRQVALALAYRQPGYSHSGVAKRPGVDGATVAAYMAEATDAYGQSVTETSLPSALAEGPDRPLSKDARHGDTGGGAT
jgi:hypothetical protein